MSEVQTLTIQNVDMPLLNAQYHALINLLGDDTDSIVWGIVYMLGDELRDFPMEA